MIRRMRSILKQPSNSFKVEWKFKKMCQPRNYVIEILYGTYVKQCNVTNVMISVPHSQRRGCELYPVGVSVFHCCKHRQLTSWQSLTACIREVVYPNNLPSDGDPVWSTSAKAVLVCGRRMLVASQIREYGSPFLRAYSCTIFKHLIMFIN